MNLMLSLKSVRSSLMNIKHALQDPDTISDSHVARDLSATALTMAEILDGLLIADLNPSSCPSSPIPSPSNSRLKFQYTPFEHAHLRAIQLVVNGMRSTQQPGAAIYANFWTVTEFWSHFVPHTPMAFRSEKETFFDFSLELGGGFQSGPVVHDILIPVFNSACKIAAFMNMQGCSTIGFIDTIKLPMHASCTGSDRLSSLPDAPISGRRCTRVQLSQTCQDPLPCLGLRTPS